MKPKVYISVVSHAQGDLIEENFADFPKTVGSYDVHLSILDNTGEPALRRFCEREKIFYHHDGKREGFGANHNKMFRLLAPRSEDLFIVCNPDIAIFPDQLEGMVHSFFSLGYDLMAPRSYLDRKSGQLDYPDRYFPYLANFAVSILTGKRLHYGSNDEQTAPEWLSGSFILFRPDVFRTLGGFDEGYFMYCEDIDICYRAQQHGYRIGRDTRHFIEHRSRMSSRKLLSKSLLWHMRSALRFSIKTGRLFGLKRAS